MAVKGEHEHVVVKSCEVSQDQWLTSTAGTMKRSLRLKDSIRFMSSSDREKSNPCKFCWILEGVTLLGIHTTPLWMCHLRMPHGGGTRKNRPVTTELIKLWKRSDFFSCGLEAVIPYLSMTWAGVFWYLRAMAPSRGSSRRPSSSGEAQGLSPLPRGL